MVGDAGVPRVDVGAAELLGRHVLAGRRLHERRAADEDRPRAAHDHGLVRHRRHVGAAGGARAHHDGDLRDALRRHLRLVEEDPAEVLAVGEDLGLQRQERAARVDEVDARQPVLLGHLLRAQVLLHREREVRAALDGRVVRDDHALAALDDADPGHDPGARRVAVVHLPGGERVQLEEGGAGVDEPVDPLAGGQLAARAVPLRRLLAAAARRPAPSARAARRRAPPSAPAGARTPRRRGRAGRSGRPRQEPNRASARPRPLTERRRTVESRPIAKTATGRKSMEGDVTAAVAAVRVRTRGSRASATSRSSTACSASSRTSRSPSRTSRRWSASTRCSSSASAMAGPAYLWLTFIPVAGMLFVALVFGELASHYPVAGALFQYSKFSVGPRYGWFVGWFYGFALLDHGRGRRHRRRRLRHRADPQLVRPGTSTRRATGRSS